MSIKAQLEAIAKKRMQDVDDIYRTSVIRVGNRIVTATPVDKASLINHWNTSIGSPKYDKSRPNSNAGADSINELAQTINGSRVGEVAYFNNPMPYGPRIEYDGYSEKAKNGMVRINTDLWETIVNEEVAKRK